MSHHTGALFTVSLRQTIASVPMMEVVTSSHTPIITTPVFHVRRTRYDNNDMSTEVAAR